MAEMEFKFEIELTVSMQRQLRRNKFLLLKKIRDRLVKFAELIKDTVKVMLPKDTGNLQDSVKVRKVQEDEYIGIYQYTVYVDQTMAPYARFVDSGRAAGYAPYKKLRKWVERKFGLSGREAHWSTLGVLWKLYTVGFNGNKAPYNFINKATNEFNGSLIRRLIDEVNVDVDNVFSAWR